MTGSYRQESLSEALLALIRQQITAFLIFWMLVNIPVICQYHSMMSPWDVAPDAHHRNEQPQHNKHNSGDCKLHNHDLSTHLMSLLDSLVAIMPVSVVTGHSFKLTEHSVVVEEWPPEIIIPPPEQPPRSA